MRTPRENEAEVSSEPVAVTVIRSVDDPEVYATITPIGTDGVVMLTVHISGEHPRMPEVAVHGRDERAADHEVMVARARRLVAEHVDYRAMERGTLVRERPNARGASQGALSGWPSKWHPAEQHAEARRVVTAWAEGRMAALGATTWDLHWQDGQPIVSFRLDLADVVPARQQCTAFGNRLKAVQEGQR